MLEGNSCAFGVLEVYFAFDLMPQHTLQVTMLLYCDKLYLCSSDTVNLSFYSNETYKFDLQCKTIKTLIP